MIINDYVRHKFSKRNVMFNFTLFYKENFKNH